MIRHIYIERAVQHEPATLSLCKKFPHAKRTNIDYFGEVFNAKGQNFRLIKKEPAAILAKKQGNLILPIPQEFSLGSKYNYYFSHAYNCLYDCRYCFLQAMYASANYVFFVNHDDFIQAIKAKASEVSPEKVWFFSGYDCDSLSFEPITGFAARFIEAFRPLDNAILELRTKSTSIKSLLTIVPSENVVVAFSLSPDEMASRHDHKAPSINKRLNAIARLADHGWQIGFRFDPLIYYKDFANGYKKLCQELAKIVPKEQRHSVTYGTLRFPQQQYKRIVDLYPEEPLLATIATSSSHKSWVGYSEIIESQLLNTMQGILDGFIDRDKVFSMAE